MKIRHLKKIKPGLPPVWFPTKKSPFTIYFIPRESTKYVQPNVYEQEDWLKSLGLSFSPIFNAHKNSIMLGWRYNPSTQLFEFAPYWHDSKGDNHYPEKDDLPIIHAKVNEVVKMIIKPDSDDFQKVTISNLTTNYHYSYLVDVDQSKWARTISPWFGGTLPPPSTVCYDLYWNITGKEALKLV